MKNGREVYSWGGWVSRSTAASRPASWRNSTSSTRPRPSAVEAARSLFRRRALDDFDPIGNRGRKWRHKDTGREYLLDESQVLMSTDPRRTGVEFLHRPRRSSDVHAGARLRRLRARRPGARLFRASSGNHPAGAACGLSRREHRRCRAGGAVRAMKGVIHCGAHGKRRGGLRLVPSAGPGAGRLAAARARDRVHGTARRAAAHPRWLQLARAARRVVPGAVYGSRSKSTR